MSKDAKLKKTSKVKPVRRTTKKKGLSEYERKIKRISNFVILGSVLFFWYLSYGNISTYISNNLGSSYVANIYQSLLSVLASLIFTYLIAGLIKPELINLKISFVTLTVLILVCIVVFVMFPISVFD